MKSLIHSSRPIALGVYSRNAYKTAPQTVNIEAHAFSPNDSFKDRHCLSLVVARLRDIRQARGLSLREVSRRVRVAEELLDMAENGKQVPNSRIFKAWCRALHLSWEQVWGDSLDY